MVELVVTHSEFMYPCTVCSTNVRLVNHANPLLTKMLSRKRGSLVNPPPALRKTEELYQGLISLR